MREDFAYLRISHHSILWKIQASSIFSHLFNVSSMACSDKMSHFFLRCYYTQTKHEVPIGCLKSFLKSKIKSDYKYWKCFYAHSLYFQILPWADSAFGRSEKNLLIHHSHTVLRKQMSHWLKPANLLRCHGSADQKDEMKSEGSWESKSILSLPLSLSLCFSLSLSSKYILTCQYSKIHLQIEINMKFSTRNIEF